MPNEFRTSNELIRDIEDLRFEPTRLQRLMVKMTEDATLGNLKLTDPTIPIVKLLEVSSILTAAGVRNDYLLDRKSYPIMSTTDDDLFNHMVDIDFVDMFSMPSKAKFDIYVSKTEIVERSVPIGSSRSRKLTIPRHTSIVVNGIPFTMQYPINFLVKSHGGLDVVYGMDKPSPLQHLPGNKVDWDVIKLKGISDEGGLVELVRLSVPVEQMEVTTIYETISAAKVLKKEVSFKDKFFSVRASMKNIFGAWEEIKVTHSQQSFDPNDPTLLLKVIGNTLTYELPHVYLIGGLVGRELRIDVYTTRAEMNMDLSGLTGSMYSITFKDLDNDDNGLYTAPVSTLRTFDIRSTDVVSGGRDAPTFDVRRSRMLENNIGPNVIPITNVQVQNELNRLGFDTLMNVDDLVSRTYLATRLLPTNIDGNTRGGIESTTLPYRGSVDTISKLPFSIDNGNRVTILPSTLYSNVDGRLQVLDKAEKDRLEGLPAEAFINVMNDNNYLWTPFHYVLDSNDHTFRVRPYSMNDPSLRASSYMSSNETIGLTIMASNRREIVATETGYKLTILSDSSKDWKELPDSSVHVQLGFKPDRESSYAFTNGVLLEVLESGERVYEFDIKTNWDMDSQHLLDINNFSMPSGGSIGFRSKLEQSFSLFWAVSDYAQPGLEDSDIDAVMGTHLLPPSSLGVYWEEIEVKLGDELTGLWSRARNVLGDRSPLRRKEPVYMTYLKNEYVIDPQTGHPRVIIKDGLRSLELKHAKGDVVIDAVTSLPVELYAKGSIVMEDGKAVFESNRYTMCWFDIVLFDAKYRYVSSDKDVEYVEFIPRVIVDWVNDLLKGMQKNTLEVTDLYFQPKNTLKHIPVLVDDGREDTIFAAQRLTIDIFVTSTIYSDFELRKAIEEATLNETISGIQGNLISVENIEKMIKDINGEDIITVKVTGLGGNKEFRVVTLLDGSTSLSVGTLLTMEDNGRMSIADSIQVNFRKHSTT